MAETTLNERTDSCADCAALGAELCTGCEWHLYDLVDPVAP